MGKNQLKGQKMSRLKELRRDQREERVALLCEMFANEDADVVFERERDELQGRDLTPVVKHLNSLLRKKEDKKSEKMRKALSEISFVISGLNNAIKFLHQPYPSHHTESRDTSQNNNQEECEAPQLVVVSPRKPPVSPSES